VFERQHGTVEDALKTTEEAIAKFPEADKLYMIKGQILDSQGNVSGAREAYAAGTKKVPTSVPLWLLASRLEEKAGLAIKARALLERARHYNPKNDELWLESIRVEERQGSAAQAKATMARGASEICLLNVPSLTPDETALQEVPASPLLWAESIWMEDRPKRKTRSVDALKKANNHPLVLVAVARLFWAERKLDKARSWFERAANANPDLGDSWAWWYKFELQHGTPVSVSVSYSMRRDGRLMRWNCRTSKRRWLRGRLLQNRIIRPCGSLWPRILPTRAQGRMGC
jgi:pre-mRNA-processing factor 6